MVRRYVVARQKARNGLRWLILDLKDDQRTVVVECSSRSEARRRCAEMNLTFNMPPKDFQQHIEH